MLKAILIGFFCFLLFLALHVIIFRAIDLKERFRALSLIFFGIIPVYIILYAAIPQAYFLVMPTQAVDTVFSPRTVELLSTGLNFMSGLMLYIFLFLGYCQFYFIVDRSISVRVMIEIDKNPDKKLTFDDIMRVYSFNGILSRRLEHMVEGKYLVKDGEYYVNTEKGRLEALCFRFIKEFLQLGPGG